MHRRMAVVWKEGSAICRWRFLGEGACVRSEGRIAWIESGGRGFGPSAFGDALCRQSGGLCRGIVLWLLCALALLRLGAAARLG